MPVTLKGSTSGDVTLTVPAVAGTSTVTLPAATGTAIVSTTSSPAQGDIIYFNGTNWVSLAAGTSGQLLRTNGAAANPSWQTNGWTFVSKTTASNSATLDVTDLGSYSAIRITINSLLPATDNTQLLLRFSSDNGATYIATNTYKYANSGINDAATARTTVSTGDSALKLIMQDNLGNLAADGGYSGTVILSSFNLAIPTFASGSVSYGNNFANAVVGTIGGFQTGSTAMNAFRLLMDSGNITSGSIVVEGMA